MSEQPKALQNTIEHERFCALLRKEEVRSYLEIGSKFGGSLYRVSLALPPGSKLVAVDLPVGDSIASLKSCVQFLQAGGHEARLVLGDSTDAEVVERVRAHGPYDCVFIDGNHLLPFVMKDWANYGPMGKIVAFHDISWKGPRPGKASIDVPQFWEAIKIDYRHEEIRLEARDNGIGVLWRN
jgi:predicted O-methyltransferase YrrM